MIFSNFLQSSIAETIGESKSGKSAFVPNYLPSYGLKYDKESGELVLAPKKENILDPKRW